jgi:hypothetical protein
MTGPESTSIGPSHVFGHSRAQAKPSAPWASSFFARRYWSRAKASSISRRQWTANQIDEPSGPSFARPSRLKLEKRMPVAGSVSRARAVASHSLKKER